MKKHVILALRTAQKTIKNDYKTIGFLHGTCGMEANGVRKKTGIVVF